MKKSRSFFALLIFCLSFVLIPAIVKADMWDVPVAPGETFRWVFVTSLTIEATSPLISTYNDLVNLAADIEDSQINSPLTGEAVEIDSIGDIEWYAIASTQAVNAIDNIGGESTVRIFLAGTQLEVASSTADLFDRSIAFSINISETLTPLPNGERVWTGTNTEFGTGMNGLELGQSYNESTTGEIGYLYNLWIGGFIERQDTQNHLYSISEELTVVPVPSALILGATGLLSSTLGLIRLRRKHQE